MDKSGPDNYDKYNNLDRDNNISQIRLADYEFLETIGVGKIYKKSLVKNNTHK